MIESTKSTSVKSQYKIWFLLYTEAKNDYPQCVICCKVLGNDSLRPSKRDVHLKKYHTELAEKRC